MHIAIIGGGAAGFFSAIRAKETHPASHVVIFEKKDRLLSKVKISGGGRCNVTNACATIDELCAAYPRGGRSLKKLFHRFSNHDAMRWFEDRGVPLVVQDDCCVFPRSQDAQSILDVLLNEARKHQIEVHRKTPVTALKPAGHQWQVVGPQGQHQPALFDKVIVTTGGSPRKASLDWLEALGHKIEPPIPSLFTFHMPGDPVTQLAGIVADHARVSIQGTKFRSDGPLLITHWGMSGPAILKLSSYGARYLNEAGYRFTLQVNWAGETNREQVAATLAELAEAHPRKMLANIRPFSLPERLWLYLLDKCELPRDKKWGETGRKGLNKLANYLINDEYTVRGKATYKDEFVTCGGVSLKSVDLKTMQSKVCPNLYFAGEVLDIDALTGGFNFQAAWSTGFVAGEVG
ncbi:MAG: NAD(P)/FAD-dependent oxidoreductase [Marinilabiliaceae bacterium]